MGHGEQATRALEPHGAQIWGVRSPHKAHMGWQDAVSSHEAEVSVNS